MAHKPLINRYIIFETLEVGLAILIDDGPCNVIVEAYGITASNVHYIKCGKTWTHVTRGLVDHRQDHRYRNTRAEPRVLLQSAHGLENYGERLKGLQGGV